MNTARTDDISLLYGLPSVQVYGGLDSFLVINSKVEVLVILFSVVHGVKNEQCLDLGLKSIYFWGSRRQQC